MKFTYPADGSQLDCEVDIPTGMRTVVFGPNGAGKSTLLRLLAGTIGANPWEATYLPQTVYHFRGSAGWNLGLGLNAEQAARARHLADRLGVGHLMEATAVSGGERQRFALARTLARSEPWVLLDEPLAALDTQDRMNVARVIVEAIADRSAVIVTHDQDAAVILGQNMVVLIDGAVRQTGPVHDVFAQPADAAVAAAVGLANVLDGIVRVTEGPLCSVASGGSAIWGVGDHDLGDTVRVMFGAETVTMYAGTPPSVGSARNSFIGMVTEVRPVGRFVEVVLDAGIPIVALLTPGSLEALGLKEGVPATAVVKATAVRVVPS